MQGELPLFASLTGLGIHPALAGAEPSPLSPVPEQHKLSSDEDYTECIQRLVGSFLPAESIRLQDLAISAFIRVLFSLSVTPSSSVVSDIALSGPAGHLTRRSYATAPNLDMRRHTRNLVSCIRSFTELGPFFGTTGARAHLMAG